MSMGHAIRWLIVALGAVAIPAGYATASTQGGERILSYHSDIAVRRDATMLVRETIRVHSTGSQIRHGIHRGFPTRYRGRHGNRYVVGFDVTEVTRDGRPEPWHTGRMKNGVRVYIGDKDRLVPAGDHTYTIAYETDWQIGFFRDHDELYWNVTGNGWAFPIESASATVRVEGLGADQVGSYEAYTGPQGARGRAYTAGPASDGGVRFSTTAPLGRSEGLTIVVAWPKGVVQAPTDSERLLHLVDSDWGAAVAGIGVLAVFGYYLFVWSLVGKDPAKGLIIPLYEPPRGFSPAAVRFIWRMGYDSRTFAAAVIDMAVKGYLSLRQEDGTYTIVRGTAKKSVLSPEEAKIAGKLLGRRESLKLEQEHHTRIRAAIDAAKESLRKSFEKTYFLTNRRHFVVGLILSLLVVVLIGLAYASPGALFMMVWLTGWSVGVVALVTVALAQWWRVVHAAGNRLSALGQAGFISLFALPFVGFEIFGFWALTSEASVWMLVALLVLAGLNCLFYHLLKAPTMTGRALMDQFDGFRMFLSVADKDRLEMLHPPGRTPELFEAYLPYALALGVEQQWSEQFADVLAQAGEGGQPYSPVWYSGAAWSVGGAAAFSSSLGSSLSGAISSSSAAPGSSSGGGGGGSSGGGGGGGGGGGW